MSPNCVSSRALRTSDADTLLCCFDAATSCALRKRTMSSRSGTSEVHTYVAAENMDQHEGLVKVRESRHTEIVHEYGRAFQ